MSFSHEDSSYLTPVQYCCKLLNTRKLLGWPSSWYGILDLSAYYYRYHSYGGSSRNWAQAHFWTLKWICVTIQCTMYNVFGHLWTFDLRDTLKVALNLCKFHDNWIEFNRVIKVLKPRTLQWVSLYMLKSWPLDRIFAFIAQPEVSF